MPIDTIETKEAFLCPECGSETILKDAYASWSVEKQQYILHSVYTDWNCDECGAMFDTPITVNL